MPSSAKYAVFIYNWSIVLCSKQPFEDDENLLQATVRLYILPKN